MTLTRAERWIAATNIALVAVFSAWSIGVAYGRFQLSACCKLPNYAEAVLAAVNFPSWFAAALAANSLYAQDFTSFVAFKQLVWLSLCGPQWWAYIFILRVLRDRLRKSV
jgi:hypothetical protein